MNYTVFVRTWWRKGPNNTLIPGPGRKKVLRRGLTEEEARRMCEEYNRNNDPGPLSRKAEFTSNY